MSAPFYQFTVTRLDGTTSDLRHCVGKVVLVVNTASRCSFTMQYAALEKIYRTYADKGLLILGFPCNQFASQEPGSAGDIASFCEAEYNITFPLFSKIAVNGKNAHPLYRYLKAAVPGLLGMQTIKWNFTKFLIDRQGKVVRRFAPTTKPEALIKYIERLLEYKQ